MRAAVFLLALLLAAPLASAGVQREQGTILVATPLSQTVPSLLPFCSFSGPADAACREQTDAPFGVNERLGPGAAPPVDGVWIALDAPTRASNLLRLEFASVIPVESTDTLLIPDLDMYLFDASGGWLGADDPQGRWADCAEAEVGVEECVTPPGATHVLVTGFTGAVVEFSFTYVH